MGLEGLIVGVVALVGAIYGYGRLSQKVSTNTTLLCNHLKHDTQEMWKALDSIREDVAFIKGKLDD